MTAHIFACYVLYCSEVGINVYKSVSIFYKCMQTIKLRQTAENNGGPCMTKSDAKGVP